jgi:ActR/RegA family two-component response regulator
MTSAQRVLIIDDDAGWRTTLATYFRLRRWEVEEAASSTEAEAKSDAALQAGRPFTLATVDMGFVIGGVGQATAESIHSPSLEMPMGGHILNYLKSRHPYIACVMISGYKELTIEDVIDLRDDHNLDYFIHKHRVNTHLDETIRKALQRVEQSLTPFAIPPRLFISYRRQSSWGIALLVKTLLEQRGLDVFIDLHSMGSGKFDDRLIREVQTCDCFIVILAPDTLESDWVRRECQIALEAQRRIIPVMIDGFEFRHAELPADLHGLDSYNGLLLSAHDALPQIQKLTSWIVNGDDTG